MLKPIDNTFRKKIQYAIKNRVDLSDMINGYDISNMNLDNSIITKLDLTNETITGTSFSYCVLGSSEGGIFFNNTTLINCSFQDSSFPGVFMARRAIFTGCNFRCAYMPNPDYRYAQFKDCNFCESVFRIGSRSSFGAIFDEKFFGDVGKYLGIKIMSNDEYKKLKQLEEMYGQDTIRTKA